MSVINEAPFQLKGSMFTLTVMHLQHSDLNSLAEHLNKLTSESPKFFLNMPIVIDLENIAHDTPFNFQQLTSILRESGLIPIGVKNGNAVQQAAANAAGLASLQQKIKTKSSTPAEAKQPAPKKETNTAKIITQPVRSGQQIYAKGTDLIILASVSAGSEVIADGNIHVYGTLRGRALAGVQGNTAARIICSALTPELISIAGRYQTQDQFTIPTENGPYQVILKDDQLECSAIKI